MARESMKTPKNWVKVLPILVIVGVSSLGIGMGVQVLRDRAQILVNNVGFFPEQEKSFFVAMEREHAQHGSFDVINQLTGKVVYQGNLEYRGWKWSRNHWLGNFTALETPGTYIIEAQVGLYKSTSHPFVIDAQYLDDVLRTSVYWYYYQRCGVATQEIVEGYPGHELCHEQDAWYLFKNPDGTYEYRNDLNLTGGWHDSGDYNVYSPRMAKANYALLFAFEQVPSFFLQAPQAIAYPDDAAGVIPDVLEDAYFGLQWWTRRWYPVENRFFDSNMLGVNGSLRWTVFGPAEYEDDFGDGRWVADDDEPGDDDANYTQQFVQSSNGLLVAATYAAMARICAKYGYYSKNVSGFEDMARLARLHYAPFLANNTHSFVCELEMYKLTGEPIYLENAQTIAWELLKHYETPTSFGDDFLTLGFLLDFAREYQDTLPFLDYVRGNGTLQLLTDALFARTMGTSNIYNLMLDASGKPAYNNQKFFDAQMVASLIANLTTNSSARAFLQEFLTRHFDWLLGRNIENLCQVEGVPGGENPIFENHHRYAFSPGLLRGACPGWIIDGFEYFAGEPGEKNDPNRYPMPQPTRAYTEVWSDVVSSFLFGTSTFYNAVLNRN